MEFEAWEPFYEEILKDFGFSREKDEAGTGFPTRAFERSSGGRR